jgi:hypothetical protein
MSNNKELKRWLYLNKAIDVVDFNAKHLAIKVV